jgi:hypothetical protein
MYQPSYRSERECNSLPAKAEPERRGASLRTDRTATFLQPPFWATISEVSFRQSCVTADVPKR